MPSPKRTAERKGLEAATPVEAKANGLLHESCEQLDATCTKSLRIKFSDSRKIGLIQTMQFGSFGRARHLIGPPRLGLTLEDRSLKAEAERQIELTRCARGIEAQIASLAFGQNALHQPLRGAKGLKTRRGDDHGNGGEVRAMGEPHGRSKDPSDFVVSHDAVANLTQKLPVLGAMRPADAN